MVELQINRVQINHARPVCTFMSVLPGYFWPLVSHDLFICHLLPHKLTTRKHFSRMHTVRCSGCQGEVVSAQGGGVCPGGYAQGCVCLGGSVCLGGVSAQGGVCPGGVSLEDVCLGGVCLGGACPGGVSAKHSPPCEKNDCQTPVKILPCRNFVADGKKQLINTQTIHVLFYL